MPEEESIRLGEEKTTDKKMATLAAEMGFRETPAIQIARELVENTHTEDENQIKWVVSQYKLKAEEELGDDLDSKKLAGLYLALAGLNYSKGLFGDSKRSLEAAVEYAKEPNPRKGGNPRIDPRIIEFYMDPKLSIHKR